MGDQYSSHKSDNACHSVIVYMIVCSVNSGMVCLSDVTAVRSLSPFVKEDAVYPMQKEA